MTHNHSAKCPCGKGTASFYIDSRGHKHSEITCPDCARKYHVTFCGLIPRHIPLKHPKDRLVKDIEREEWYQRREAPLYHEDVVRTFMTPEEIAATFIHNERDDSYHLRLFDDNAMRMHSNVWLMAEWACKYSKRDLLILHDTIDDSIYTPESDKFLREYRYHSEEEIVALLKRTIIDYERHIPHQEKWREEKSKGALELEKLYEKLKEARAKLEQRWKDETIPWETLEA